MFGNFGKQLRSTALLKIKLHSLKLNKGIKKRWQILQTYPFLVIL